MLDGGEEDIERYELGGFHPIHIGDMFVEGRYTVVHKLGSGGFSTVWLTRDEKMNQYVALKVISADASASCSELGIYQLLESGLHSSDTSGCDYLALLLDHFEISGPNGRHVCLVSRVGGPSIASLSVSPGEIAGTRRLKGSIARDISRQTVQAMSCLHSVGIVHGGMYLINKLPLMAANMNDFKDFTTSNILLQVANFDHWSIEEVYKRLGKPETSEIKIYGEDTPGPCAPRYCVSPIKFDGKSEHLVLTDQILVVDFGQSFPIDKPPVEMVATPLSYQAPELIFEKRASVHSDIWSLGCVLYEIYAGLPSFEVGFGGENEVLRQMVEVIGKFPEPWWKSWQNRHLYFDENGCAKIGSDTLGESSIDAKIMAIGSDDGTISRPNPALEIQRSKMQSDRPDREPLLEAAGVTLTRTEAMNLKALLTDTMKYAPAKRAEAKDLLNYALLTFA